MELLNTIFHFFTDNTKKFTHKTILILFSIALIVFIDNTLSFTYSFNNKNRLEQIEKLNIILKDTSLTKNDKNKLESLRTNIIQHQTWKDLFYEKITSFDFKNREDNSKITIKNDVKNKSSERVYWIHFISSSWLCIFMMIVLPIYGLFDKNTSFLGYLFLIIFIIEPIFYSISWVFAKIFSLIPVIDNNPNFNYILNAILHLSVFLILGFVINKFNKKKTEIVNQYNNISNY